MESPASSPISSFHYPHHFKGMDPATRVFPTQKILPEDPPVVQTHTCSADNLMSAEEGGNIEEGFLDSEFPVNLICSAASSANYISEKVYLKAKAAIAPSFADLSEVTFRPGVDKVVVRSLYGRGGVDVKGKAQVPVTYQGRKFVVECLVMEKPLFGGAVDVVLGDAFVGQYVESVTIDEDGRRIHTLAPHPQL
ncbi:hypothetical protein BSKO_00443 [Bryopsis sp. KO-2023]|nr:hypothetical protein BSKO_00443 [Bryopsis sp. KO-2023]